MRIGIHLRHWEGTPHDLVPLARAAETAGLDSVWMSETWGSDAMVLATWVAAHTERIDVGLGVAQMPGRTPANAAMGAITVDHLSGGRFRLGLGTSGPQVAEGWHGTVFDHPLERTREYVDIVRAIVAREAPVAYDGRHYHLPAVGGTGFGKPLKTNVRPVRPAIPIYLASMGPRNVALAAEVADGWMPLLYSPEHTDVFAGSLREGAEARDPSLGPLDIAPMAWVSIGDDLDACRAAIRSLMALYVGAFGSKETNFYHALVARCGFEAEAARIQELALAGERAEAAAAVPDRLVDEFALLGTVAHVAERLRAYRDAGVTTLLVQTTDLNTIRAVAEAAELGGVT